MVNEKIPKTKILGDPVKGYSLYRQSALKQDEDIFVIGKDKKDKYLFILSQKPEIKDFIGEQVPGVNGKESYIKKCPLTWENLEGLRKIFPHLNPSTCKGIASFGTGDRLGMVTAAHIRAFEGKSIFPVIAQQSVRELARTGRNWKKTLASAIWGYFEAGADMPFGSDADHVKQEKDLKGAADAGFTMFTVDPSDHINGLSGLSKDNIAGKYNELKNIGAIEKKFLDKEISLDGKKTIIDKDKLVLMAVRYSKALEKVSDMYCFLKGYLKIPFDFEVSMDEIEEPVSPIEHYFISSELKAMGVHFDNLALRYPGRWEKAVDHMGDIKEFESELNAHSKIAEIFGGYKLSLHSGSEKFSTYKAFSSFNSGIYHIKTAGTSYLEAIRTIAGSDPSLFRDIYAISLQSFEKDKDSYHLTTDTSKLLDIDKLNDGDLKGLLDKRESRQVLHVAFGTILTDSSLKERLVAALFKNEDNHYGHVKENIENHLKLLT